MQKYKRKTANVIVEAEQLNEFNLAKLANEAQAQIVEEGRVDGDMTEGLNIRTPNGKERLHQGMYLIKFKDKFYTAAAVNFEREYELYFETSAERADIENLRPNLDNPWGDIPRINP